INGSQKPFFRSNYLITKLKSNLLFSMEASPNKYTPNSPSVNSRSSTLGPSLSLGNISGMTANPEVKKRRAPPPPVLTPPEANGQGKASEELAFGASLNDLQKKKRRAPLPPTQSAPPTPAMPNRREEMEDKRKSTMGERRSFLLCNSIGSRCSIDDVMELSEVEETASESSCFASEDTTEDSGVVSSPSDIVSLDSQNDSMKLRDIKLVNGYVDSDAIYGAETCSVKNVYCDNMGYANSEHMSEALSPHTRKVEVPQDVASSVPVTVIDDAPEVTICNSAGNQETRGSQNLSADSVNMGNFTNRNNNAGSFDKGHTDGGAVCIPKDLIHQNPSENEFSQLPVEQRRDMFESLTSSFEKRSEKNVRVEAPPRHLTSSHSKTATEINTAKEKVNPFNECSKRERPLKKSKSELEIKRPPAKKIEVEEVPSTPPWCHRAQKLETNYEPKMGLTTFKVVPPKPEVKNFDRGLSVSTGAIKIDELGNLINPKPVVSKNIPGTSAGESEEIPLGKVKAFWRSSSMEKQSDDSAEHLAKKPAVTTNSKSFVTKQECKPVCLAAPKPVPPQTVISQVGEKQSENEKTKPPLPVTQSQVKPLVVPAINKDKPELPFLKPHRRTSSQYVASAIAKHINLPTFKSDSTDFHEKDENKHGAGEVKTEAEVSPKRCIIVAKYSPVETESAETREKISSIFTCSQKASHRFTPGDNSGMENKVVNIRAPSQATPASFYKKNASVPLTKSSSKDNNKAEDDHSLNSKQGTAEKKMHLLFDQKCETLPLSSLKASPEFSGVTAKAESEQNDKSDDSAANAIGELDVNVQTNIFGPKKKFKPVVQKPIPKDTSLHSALMEAIQTGGGKEKLRKVKQHEGEKPSYSEPENERSALLAAIRGHSGTSKLKKTDSREGEIPPSAIELSTPSTGMLSTEKEECRNPNGLLGMYTENIKC
uniref:WH2 domain-containing protein n=1 Tax=Pavo cristatus TaxID=9049 RepID=A0A8C9FI78_PAVCR